MCIAASCFRPLRSGVYDWARAISLTALDHEVYTLYGHPSIKDGMTLEDVSRIVRTR